MNRMLERRVAFVTDGRGGIDRAICGSFKDRAHVFASDLNRLWAIANDPGSSVR
jgi:NAD(P)-dependent dehydrogenase (short-subunit alcohol dehydrogenase family)